MSEYGGCHAKVTIDVKGISINNVPQPLTASKKLEHLPHAFKPAEE